MSRVDVVTDVKRDANGLEVLGPDECLRLMRTQMVGRIGISSGALPLVLPVHFVIVGDEIIFEHGTARRSMPRPERPLSPSRSTRSTPTPAQVGA